MKKEITEKIDFLHLSIILCMLILLISCDNNDRQRFPDFLPEDGSETTPGDISDKLVARIYFDATLSMQGFVVPDSTRYTQICPYLESVIVSGWKDETVHFFRFGEQVEGIDRDTYLQAGYAGFYEKENIYRETFIQKIIDYEDKLANDSITKNIPEESPTVEVSDTSEKPTEAITHTQKKSITVDSKEQHLVVIVTDLFQDKGDINRLVSELKEKYIKKGLEVGLFGLRSQFDGTVYDIGIGQEPLPYKNTQDPQTFRPFYLLVLGRHADIAHYFDRLIANGFSEAKTIIFSRYLVDPLLSFEGVKVDPRNLNNKIVNRNHSQNSILKQYEIVSNSERAKISAKMAYFPLPHAMPFDANTFEDSIIAEYKPDSSGENERSPDAINCLEVTSTFSENELTIAFALTEFLPRKDVYLYEVTLYPAIDTYKVPDWCSDWNMGVERNGARTLNLVNFVRGLTETTVLEHFPNKIAQFHFYIKKR